MAICRISCIRSGHFFPVNAKCFWFYCNYYKIRKKFNLSPRNFGLSVNLLMNQSNYSSSSLRWIWMIIKRNGNEMNNEIGENVKLLVIKQNVCFIKFADFYWAMFDGGFVRPSEIHCGRCDFGTLSIGKEL